jgi:hypothetical protein
MSDFTRKAVIFKDLEDVYGPCGCGMDMAILPVLLPRDWLMEENPCMVDDHAFCTGLDFRRISGFSHNNVFEHQIEGEEFLANFSCCRECADRAVECGYAVWSSKSYPMTLR